MKIKKLLSLSILLSALSITNLGAAEGNFKDNKFADRAEKVVPKPGEESNPLHDYTNNNSAPTTRGLADGNATRRHTTKDKKDGGGGGQDEQKDESSPRTTNFLLLNPMTGMGETLMRDDIQQYFEELKNGPLATWHVAMIETEPAVGAGVMNALQNGSEVVANRYLAAQNLHLNLAGEEKKHAEMMASYAGCMAKALKQGGQSQAEWMAADEGCRGEELKAPRGSGKKKKGKRFSVKDHPDNEDQGGGGAGGGGEREIKLSTRLFPENSQSPDIQELKKSWLEIIGDLVLKEKEGAGQDAGAVIVLEEQYIPPDGKDSGKPGDTVIGDFIVEETRERLKDLVKVLNIMCEAYAATHGSVDSGSAPDIREADQENLFMQDNISKIAEHLQRLSTPGRPLQEIVADSFFSKFRMDHESAAGLIECQELKPEYADNPEQIPPRHKPQWVDWQHYVEYVAYQRVLRTYYEAKLYVESQTSEDDVFNVRQQALGLITRALGFPVDDLLEKMRTNEQELLQFIVRFQAELANRVGKRGGAVTVDNPTAGDEDKKNK